MDKLLTFLRKRWRFVLIAFVAFTLWFSLSSTVSGMIESVDSNQRSANGSMEKLVTLVAEDTTNYDYPANKVVAELRSEQGLLDALLVDYARKIAWERSPRFSFEASGIPAKDVDARHQHFLKVLSNVGDRLAYAKYWRPEIIGTSNDVNYSFDSSAKNRLSEQMLYLDVLNRVAEAAEDSEVDSVESFSFERKEQLSTVTKRLPSTQPAKNDNEDRGGGSKNAWDPMLYPVGVELEVHGTLESLFRMVTDLVQFDSTGAGGRSFCLESGGFSNPEGKSSSGGKLVFRALLVVYEVNPEADLPNLSLKEIAVREAKLKGDVVVEEEASFSEGDERRGSGRNSRGRGRGGR